MKKRVVILIAVLTVFALIASGCGAAPADDAENSTPPEDLQTFTIEELAAYDGKDGNKAYIAVGGLVYDVTDVKVWAGGAHHGFTAGADQTEALDSKAPHGANMLNGIPVVGKLEE